MPLEAAIAALQGPKTREALPNGVPESDRAAFTYVNEAGKQGRPATATPTPGGGLDVLTQGSERPADLRAKEAANDGPLSGAIEALTGPVSSEKPKPVINEVPAPGAQQATKPQSDDSWLSRQLKERAGMGEAALTAGTGIVAAPVAAVGGVISNLASGKFGTQEGIQIARDRAKEIMDSLTYQPRTEAGKENVAALGDAMEASKLQGVDPGQMNSLASVMAGKVRPQAKVPVMEAGPRAMASAGAAGSEPIQVARASLANASPELRGPIEQGLAKGMKVNQEVLDRHIEADSLPVKVHLTKGQATQDVELLSREQNSKGKDGNYAKRFNEQNKALVENVNRIREEAAPDVFAQNKPEHGDLLIEAYKAKDKELNVGISAKYKALEDANGGSFPIDAKTFVDNADKALHKQLAYDHVPAPIRTTLDRLKKDGMTFENFESLRTRLANIQRSQAADGNAKEAAGIIRDTLEELPMPPGAEHLKPLADEARASARARFQMLEKDPAFNAVAKGKASADKFIDKYVINADVKNVRALMDSLPPEQRQVIASGVMNHLKGAAGVIGSDSNFSQAGYNRALEQLRPKLDLIFAPEQKKQVEALGNVARYTQVQPRGSFVNNSNTLTAALSEAGKSAAEGAANVAAGGVPIGSWFRKYSKIAAERKETKESLQPGAGVLLRNVGK